MDHARRTLRLLLPFLLLVCCGLPSRTDALTITRDKIHESSAGCTEAVTTPYCTTNDGAGNWTLYQASSAGYVGLTASAPPSTASLQSAYDEGNQIDTTALRPVIIGESTGTYGTLELLVSPAGPAFLAKDSSGNVLGTNINVPVNMTYTLTYQGNDCVTVSAAGVTTYSNACRPRYTQYAKIDDADNTQCLVPALVDVRTGSGKHSYVRCANNDAGLMYFTVDPPDNWLTTGTVIVSGRVIDAATVADGNLVMGVRLVCVRPGIDLIPSSYTGATEAATNTITFDTQYEEARWTATVTPSGTCTSTSKLWGRIEIDATGTTSNDMGTGACAGSTGCVYIAAEVEVGVLQATSP